MYYKIINTLLAFFILFGFPISFAHNSTVVAAILIIILRPQSIFILQRILKEKYVKKIIYYLLFIIFFSFFVTLYNQTLEFNIIRSLVNQLFIFFTVLLFYASLDKKISVDESHWYLINAYILQSIIILLAYNIPAFEEFVRSFQSEKTKEIAVDGYKGFRGLAIAAGQFFWIAGAYAMVFIIFAYKILEEKRTLWTGIAFFILFAGSLFTGRTIYTGLFFSFVLFLIGSNLKTSVKFIFYAGIPLLIIIPLLPTSFFESNFFGWAFEMFINYNETGSLSTTSSDGLLEDMIYMPEIKTILIGDGLWATNGVSESFYGSTDSGFMRVLLFYGIAGVFVYFFYAKFLTFGLSKTPLLNNKLGKKFLFILMSFQLLLNLKGQSMSYMTSTQTILFMFFIPYVFHKILLKKDYKN